jgi:hypothetical protein
MPWRWPTQSCHERGGDASIAVNDLKPKTWAALYLAQELEVDLK